MPSSSLAACRTSTRIVASPGFAALAIAAVSMAAIRFARLRRACDRR